jgi:formate dehydrogenase subunit gamma
MGGEALLAQAEASGRCTAEPVYCLGLCAQSPAVTYQGQPHARMTAEKLAALLAPGAAE